MVHTVQSYSVTEYRARGSAQYTICSPVWQRVEYNVQSIVNTAHSAVAVYNSMIVLKVYINIITIITTLLVCELEIL